LNFSFSFWVKLHSLTTFIVVDGGCSGVSMRGGGRRIGDRRWSTIVEWWYEGVKMVVEG